MREYAIFLMGEACNLLPYLAGFAAIAVVAKGTGVLAGAWRARGEISTNLGLWLFDLLVIMPVVLIPALVLQELFVPAAGLVELWASLPFWLVALIAVIAGDLIGYWRHRLEHHSALWEAHAVHHSDSEYNWFTLYRMHPVNRLTTVTIDTFALALLGLPPAALIANNLVRNVWGAFIHSDVPWRLGALGRILISPVAHRVHHIDDAELAGRNFATVFTFWDRLFGTWHDGKGLERCATGVEGGSRGFAGELLRPFPSLTAMFRKPSSVAPDPAVARAVGPNGAGVRTLVD